MAEEAQAPVPALAAPGPPPHLPQPPPGSIEASASAFDGAPAAGDSRMLCLNGVASARLRVLRSNPDANLRPMIQQIISEAAPLMGSIDDFYNSENPQISRKSGWTQKGTKTYKGTGQTGGNATLNVDLLTKKLRAAGQDGAEPWVCRRSNHNDSSTGGTASWNEFYAFMKTEHVQTEVAMTDTVANSKIVAEWEGARTMAPIENVGRPGSRWTDFTLAIVEMEHKIGSVFDNRVFPVLQVTCQNEPFNEFYIISAPISNWLDWNSVEGEMKLAEQSKVVVGSYASVEVFRRVPVSGSGSGSGSGRPEREAGAAGRPSTLQRKGSKVKELVTRRLSKRSRASEVGMSGLTGAGASSAVAANADPAAAAAAAAANPPATAAAPAAPVTDTSAADAAAAGAATPADAAPVGATPGEASNAPEYRIEWTMATASHARGVLPLWVQTPAVPSKVAEDVPMFTKWMAAKRQEIAEIEEPVINDVGHLLPRDESAPLGTATAHASSA